MGAALAPVAQAALVTFDDVVPGTFLVDGGPVTSGGFTFTAGTASSGGLVETTGALGAPDNDGTQALGMYFDSSVTMSRIDGLGFALVGLDFSAINFGQAGGQLVMQGLRADGVGTIQVSQNYAFDASGGFKFATLGAGDLGGLASNLLQSVNFSGCTFDGSGACVGPTFQNFNNFALDNIRAIPEPGSLALVALALGLAGVARRRAAA